jgi:hypothetical protein
MIKSRILCPLLGEQGPDTPPEDFVVINQEHADPGRLQAVLARPPSPFPRLADAVAGGIVPAWDDHPSQLDV